jgi:hypothetical protein
MDLPTLKAIRVTSKLLSTRVLIPTGGPERQQQVRGKRAFCHAAIKITRFPRNRPNDACDASDRRPRFPRREQRDTLSKDVV